MSCDHTCIDKEGKWCNECWRKILGGGFEYIPSHERLKEHLDYVDDLEAEDDPQTDSEA